MSIKQDAKSAGGHLFCVADIVFRNKIELHLVSEKTVNSMQKTLTLLPVLAIRTKAFKAP